MNGLQKILSWLGLETPSVATRPDPNGIYALLETGQRAKRTENFDIALSTLSRAMQLAETAHDITAMAIITLQKAELYIHQAKWTEAEQLLLTLRHSAQSSGQRTQLAYTLNMLGVLSQEKGDWIEARAYYEQALKVGQNASSVGGEGRAMGHLAHTYLVENNASYAAHLLRDGLPKLNTSGDIELSSYFVGVLGEALIASGQDAEGDRMLNRALRLAEQMHYRRYERMWSLALGERALTGLRYDEAQKHYQKALSLLTEVTSEKLHALYQMSKVSLYLQELDNALLYAEQAVDAAKVLSDERLSIATQAALGIALRANNQSVKAIQALQKAAEGYARLDDTQNHTTQIEVLRNLAAAQADTADDEAAVKTYEQAVELAKTMDLPLELAQSHLELGLLYSQRRQMQAAIHEWTAALVIYEGERNHAQVARLYCDIASARKYLGQGQRAMKDYEQALMLLNSVDDWSTRGIILSNAANAYTDHGDIESADAFFTEAITIANRINNRAAEATRRGNYGWFLLITGRPQQAIVMLEHAMRLSNEQSLYLQVAIQNDNLGLAHRAIGNVSAALTYHEQAYHLMNNLRDPHWQGIISSNLASMLLTVNRTDDADSYFAQALELGQAHEDIEVIIQATTGLAQVAIIHEDLETADEMLKQAITFARRADIRRLLAEALNIHSQQKAAANRYEEASELWEEAKRLFNVLHMPHLQPEWLKSSPAELN